MEDLDDVFNGEDAAPEVEEQQAEPTGVETEQVSPPEPEPEPEELSAEPAESKESAGIRQALQAERAKRQELEARLRNQESQKPAPDIFEDQEGFVGHITKTMEQRILNERLNMSEFTARKEFPDLDSKLEKYQELIAKNPSLHDEVLNSVSPYHTLVEKVNAAQEFEAMKDVDSYKAKMRAEIEAELRNEINGEKKAKADLLDSIPPSLATETSKSGMKGPQWGGPPSLDELFN